jgi:hypothetical protein
MKRTICLLAGLTVSATPAFAAKVTLGCSKGPGFVTSYFTIDTDAKTVTEYSPSGTYPAQITDDAVTWYAANEPYPPWRNMLNTYNRNTAQLMGWITAFSYYESCVKAPDRPF